MAVQEVLHVDADGSYADMRRAFDDALGSESRELLGALLASLAHRSGAAIAAMALGDLTELRAWIARLRHRLDGRDASAELRAMASASLWTLDTMLDDARVRALTDDAAGRRKRRQRLLRDEIKELLAIDALRPRAIAERTGADPAQVSRVLRQMVDAAELTRSAPDDTSDRRAVVYQLAPRHNAGTRKEVGPTSKRTLAARPVKSGTSGRVADRQAPKSAVVR